MSARRRIAILTGEPSGDRLGAALVRALWQEADVEPFGLGGPAMEAEGVRSPFPIRDLAVMGLVEVLPRAPKILARIRQTARWLEELRPDVVVTVDSPDFMKRVVRRVRPRLPQSSFVNYVAPSVWAWRSGRAAEIARLYDLQLALLPFEPAYFEAAGVRAQFVGHPAVEAAASMPDRAAARAALGIERERPALVALPGSRRGEIGRLGPVFRRVVKRVADSRPDLAVLIPAAHGVESEVREFAGGCAGDVRLLSSDGDAERQREKTMAFRAGDVALAASGSVALELAVARLPAVIAYRFAPLTWALGTLLTRHRTASLVNVLAGERVQPEFLQSNCRSGPIADALLSVLADPDLARAQREGADRAVRQVRIDGVSPSAAAARAILAMEAVGGTSGSDSR